MQAVPYILVFDAVLTYNVGLQFGKQQKLAGQIQIQNLDLVDPFIESTGTVTNFFIERRASKSNLRIVKDPLGQAGEEGVEYVLRSGIEHLEDSFSQQSSIPSSTDVPPSLNPPGLPPTPDDINKAREELLGYDDSKLQLKKPSDENLYAQTNIINNKQFGPSRGATVNAYVSAPRRIDEENGYGCGFVNEHKKC